MSFFATCAIIYCCPNQSGKNKSNPIIVLQWPLIAALNTSNLLGTKQWAKSNFGSNNIGFNVSLILSLAQLSFFLTQWILAVIPLYIHTSVHAKLVGSHVKIQKWWGRRREDIVSGAYIMSLWQFG